MDSHENDAMAGPASVAGSRPTVSTEDDGTPIDADVFDLPRCATLSDQLADSTTVRPWI
jgi:hypothetical protein